MENQRARLEKIQNLLNMDGMGASPWRNISYLHGLVVVPDESTSTWVMHTIVGGRPQSSHQIRGDWRHRLIQGGFGKRILSRMYKEMRAPKEAPPMAKIDVARLNAVMWWMQHGKGKDGGTFIELEQLELMLKSRKNEELSAGGEQ